MDVRQQLGPARAWLPLLLAGAVIGAASAFALSIVQQPVFESKATLIVGQSLQALNPNFDQLMVSQRLSTTYAEVATTRPTLEQVIDRLDLEQTPGQLATRVSAEASTDSALLSLRAQDPDPATAAAIANALAEALIAASPAIQGRQSDFQQSVDADLAATQAQIETTQDRVEDLTGLESPTPDDAATLEGLEARLITLRSTYASLLSYSAGSAANLLSVVEPAVASETPVLPRTLLNVLLGGLAGLLIAFTIAALIARLDDRIRDADAVQEAVDLSTLGAVGRMPVEDGRPEFYQLATLLQPRSGVAEAYRTVRTNIEFASVDEPLRTLLVTSAVPNEGKTITAANLAVAFAQAGTPTILVDADLRKPGVDAVFRLVNVDGLTTLLRSNSASLDGIAHATDQANLRVITTGTLPPNPAEMLASHRMRVVVDLLKSATGLVIFDAPPIRAVMDAVVLSSYLDATVLVVSAESTRRHALRQAREALTLAGANVLGVILNRVPKASTSNHYGYFYDDPRGTPVGDGAPSAENAASGSGQAPRF